MLVESLVAIHAERVMVFPATCITDVGGTDSVTSDGEVVLVGGTGARC